MSLTSNNKKNDKKGTKNPQNSASGSKFIHKPGNTKGAGVTRKPVKTGGSRGS